jgi:hypothetical protein
MSHGGRSAFAPARPAMKGTRVCLLASLLAECTLRCAARTQAVRQRRAGGTGAAKRAAAAAARRCHQFAAHARAAFAHLASQAAHIAASSAQHTTLACAWRQRRAGPAARQPAAGGARNTSCGF